LFYSKVILKFDKTDRLTIMV